MSASHAQQVNTIYEVRCNILYPRAKYSVYNAHNLYKDKSRRHTTSITHKLPLGKIYDSYPVFPPLNELKKSKRFLSCLSRLYLLYQY